MSAVRNNKKHHKQEYVSNNKLCNICFLEIIFIQNHTTINPADCYKKFQKCSRLGRLWSIAAPLPFILPQKQAHILFVAGSWDTFTLNLMQLFLASAERKKWQNHCRLLRESVNKVQCPRIPNGAKIIKLKDFKYKIFDPRWYLL